MQTITYLYQSPVKKTINTTSFNKDKFKTPEKQKTKPYNYGPEKKKLFPVSDQ